MLSSLLELTIIGLLAGSIYALGAMGFVLIYKSSMVFNFALGEMMMIGTCFLYAMLEQFHQSVWISVPVAMVAACLVAVFIERVTLRPLIGQPHEVLIMVTFGVAAMLRGVAGLIWGYDIRRLPDLLPRKPFFLGDILIPGTLVWGTVLMVILCGAFLLYYRFSRMGVAIRATAEDQSTAECVGIDVNRIIQFSWIVAAILALAAGVVGASVNGLSPSLGNIALEVMAVVLLSGLTSVGGVLIAGMILGVLLTFTGTYLGGAWQQFLPYLMVLVVMIVRPRGLFGEKRAERI
jgi:branched-chain amino acid transport system permease protein